MVLCTSGADNQIQDTNKRSSMPLYRLREREIEREREMTIQCNDNSDSFVKMPTIKFTKLFINGNFVDSISGFDLSLSLLL